MCFIPIFLYSLSLIQLTINCPFIIEQTQSDAKKDTYSSNDRITIAYNLFKANKG